ncbi:DMT family transporter [Fructobacillus papyrifericola]|uniref:EamA family transporter n=1 Tax=Fructobacillus papyrifericola TaxID=2713172 RepID=A0ABS5QTT9_9LACO|nr:EamA family transporter [Fructobacillus papyrifericola]MBS9336625.1 EamA family transporter [Fructobacillus papyrifericola]
MGKPKTGIFLAVIGAFFWGASGTVAEALFHQQTVSATWLVGLRLFSAGILLLLLAKGLRLSIFSIWQNRKSAILLLLFAFLGMLPSQLAYFMAIQYGNAPTATVLQFLGPIFIILYLSFASHTWPSRVKMLSIMLAVAGTFLLVTNGRFDTLSFALPAILWGIGAGLSQASYTLLPKELLEEFDATVVVGWGMFLSSLPFLPTLVREPVKVDQPQTILSVLFIILFGTMIAYLFYLKSTQYISPSITGMLSAVEPLTATVMSLIFLATPLGGIQLIGGGMILSTVFIQFGFKDVE